MVGQAISSLFLPRGLQPWPRLAGSLWTLTVHTAVCRMASKPPSGASRLPEIRSPCSLSKNSSTLSVKLMTFLKENGGSLLGQGSFSLNRGGHRVSVREGSGPTCSSAHDSFWSEENSKCHYERRQNTWPGPLPTQTHSATHFSGLMSV